MTAVEAFSRTAGLMTFFSKATLAHGKVHFDGTLLAAPSIRLFVARNAKLYLGKSVVISYDSDIGAINDGVIRIGNGVYLGPRCMLSAHKEIQIGDGCLFGPDVKAFDNNQKIAQGGCVAKGVHRSASICIGQNAWLGASVIILKGFEIGDGAVIDAGCIVRSNVAAGAVVRDEYEIATPTSGFERK